MSPTAPASARLLPFALAALACALILGLSVLPPSTSRILVWPWIGFAAAGWLLVIGTALYRLAAGRPYARFGGLIDAGFSLLAITAVVSTWTSPIAGALLPALLPFLGCLALPYALLPWLHPSSNPEISHRLHRTSSGLLLIILLASLLLWLRPWSGFDGASVRNAEPFGHSNTTGSFAALAATWLVFSALRLAGPSRRVALTGAALAVTVALTSQSRGAVLALAVAATVGAAIHLLSRRRYLAFALLGLLIVGCTLGASSRLRELVFHQRWNDSDRESNRQRTAMILGGVELGKERPLLGWGVGSVPHVFPRVRAALPGTADSFLHLHNTPAQLWATLGAAGLLGGLLLTSGLATRLRSACWTPERTALASGLAGAATVLLFDHPFSAPAFALLAAAHLTAWSAPAPVAGSRPGRLFAGLGVLVTLALLPIVLRDIAARAAYAEALAASDRKDPAAFRSHLLHAVSLAPGDSFYPQQYAAHLATGAPFANQPALDPASTIYFLRASLLLNPDLEYAHYNLGWLLLDTAPADSAAHFRAAALLAPQRGGVYFGLGLACLGNGNTPAALRAFATECLYDPAFFWSAEWQRPALAALRPAVLDLLRASPLPDSVPTTGLRKAWDLAAPPLADGVHYRRVRTGYGVLLGHPDGPPPVDTNILVRVELPPALAPLVPAKGWLPGPFLLGFLGTE
ncbi:MAG: hypothetical protein RIQ79_987 [Verrucomicrobiota bacterium]